MTDTRPDDDDALLDGLFAEARAADRSAALPEALAARIIADAACVQPRRSAAPAPRPGRLAGIGALLGGWPSVAGLATAAVAGLWLGAAQPVALDGLGLGGAAAYGLDDLMPGFDALAGEG